MELNRSYLSPMATPLSGPGIIKNLLKGAVVTFLSLLGIGIPLLAGYIEEVIARARGGGVFHLPDFPPASRLFQRGLRLLPVPLIIVLISYIILFLAIPWFAGIGYWTPHEKLMSWLVAIPGLYPALFTVFFHLVWKVTSGSERFLPEPAYISRLFGPNVKEILLYGGVAITLLLLSSIPFFLFPPLSFFTFFYGLCATSAIFARISP